MGKRDLEIKIESLEEAVVDLTGERDDFAKVVRDLTDQVNEKERALKDSEVRLRTTEVRMRALDANHTQKVNGLKKKHAAQVERMTETFQDQMAGKTSEHQAAVEELHKAIAAAEAETGAQVARAEKSEADVERLMSELSTVRSELNTTTEKLEAAGEEVGRLEKEAEELQAKLAATEKKLAVSESMLSTTSTAAAAAAAPSEGASSSTSGPSASASTPPTDNNDRVNALLREKAALQASVDKLQKRVASLEKKAGKASAAGASSATPAAAAKAAVPVVAVPAGAISSDDVLVIEEGWSGWSVMLLAALMLLAFAGWGWTVWMNNMCGILPLPRRTP